MEIGDHVETNKNQKNPAVTAASSVSSSLHSTQSQPNLLDSESNQTTEKSNDDEINRKSPKNRRVSFATSSQLAQYLEPINPFPLGKKVFFLHFHSFWLAHLLSLC